MTAASSEDKDGMRGDEFGPRTGGGEPRAAFNRRFAPKGRKRKAAAGSLLGILNEIHQVMRGRYALLVLAGLLVGGAAGYAGWRQGQLEYQSTGLLRIAYTLPVVMEETDQNRPMAMFDTFMASQKLLISSRRVIDAAVRDPIWKATGRPVPANPERYFAEQMLVDIKPRSEFVGIIVKDADPGTAKAAVTAVTNAYMDYYRRDEELLERQRTGVLQGSETKLKSDIDRLADQIRASSQEYGTSDLSHFFDAATLRVTKLEAALADIRLALATAPATQPSTAPDGSPVKPVQRLPETPEEIAAVDPTMRALLNERERMEQDLLRMSVLGLGEQHPSVTSLGLSLDMLKGRIGKYQRSYVEYGRVAGQSLSDPNRVPVQTAGKTAETLRNDEASLVKLHTEAKTEMKSIGGKMMDLLVQEEERDKLRFELDKLNRRIDLLRSEGAMGGRLSVISSGEIPLSPVRDTRVRFASIGGAVGFFLPGVLFGLVVFSRRRYRFSDETEADAVSRDVPLLGILPELKGSSSMSLEQRAAAQCIHQARVSLQSQNTDGLGKVYLVTSSSASEGKTSLVMSLGLSFAAARMKTLVIDGDFVGRQLTHNLEARDMEGFGEALGSGRLNGYVRKLKFGVYVLTAGLGSTRDGCGMSVSACRAILDEARRTFDVVIVDSGPILGSVEAAIIARDSDGVIFTITRGQKRENVQAAMRRLDSLGVQMAGVLFNRAERYDFLTSSYNSTYVSNVIKPAPEMAEETALAVSDRLVRFGPLVTAVMSFLPTGAGSNN